MCKDHLGKNEENTVLHTLSIDKMNVKGKTPPQNFTKLKWKKIWFRKKNQADFMEPYSFGVPISIEYLLKSLVPHVTSLVFHLLQVHSARTQQELLHRLPLPRLHHPPLLPAQQDCVRHCGRHHCRPAQTGQIVPASLRRTLVGLVVGRWRQKGSGAERVTEQAETNVTTLKEAFLSLFSPLFPHWI